MSQTEAAHVIKIAESDEQIAACFPVMKQLRSHLDETTFVETVRRLNRGGYSLAYLEKEGVAVCAAGFRFIENLFSGKTIYVDDLVTLEAHRSRGCGEAMLDWVVRRARKDGCTAVELDSGVQRYGAHRFYLTNRMIISAHHFYLKL